ncbi:MAG: hypothetical protein HYV27_19230 [Candidatus Hydrogenedentes bacterium]|nr:hypothetical protein [Candidatus Hydrogenedentota bacterium]
MKQMAVLAIAALSLAVPALGADPLRMNQIQVLATHNSYHVQPEEPRFSTMKKFSKEVADWGYSHPPLNVQLDNGIRGLELDVYYQPEGHFKVLHVPDFDYISTCDTFTDCLTVIREWSKAHPGHVPIITHIEVKDEQYAQVKTKILKVGQAEIDILDHEVLSVFDRAHLIMPDDLRRGAGSVREGLEKQGWPLLDEVRGKCVFILHNRGEHRDAFLKGNPTLAGRALFDFAEPGAPDAAFLIRDNATEADVPELVKAGYILRTMAGGVGNSVRRDTAMASGAHLVSSDYPKGEADRATGYVVVFPDDQTVRCNPVSGVGSCPEGPIAP